jgi:hypothetical protein
MANQLNGLIPILFTSLQKISRELVGMIPACMVDMTAEQAAQGQKVRVPVTPPAENQDINIGSAPTVSSDKIGYIDIEITKFRIGKPIVWNGEEEKALGTIKVGVLKNQIEQRMRSLVNEMEEDACLEAVIGAGGGVWGTAGNTPFQGDDLEDISELVRIHNEIGSPKFDRQLVINTKSAAKLRNKNVLYRVNESGTADLLRQGIIGKLEGFDVRESGGFRRFNPTGTGYVSNGAYSKGADDIIIDTGTGAIKKGSIVTFAGDLTKYIVAEDFAGSAGHLKIAFGLNADLASGTAMTIGSAYLPNVALTRDAVAFAARTPFMPEGGDEALDVIEISDPETGLSFQVAYYGRYRQKVIEIGAAWGVKTVNPQHSVILLG